MVIDSLPRITSTEITLSDIVTPIANTWFYTGVNFNVSSGCVWLTRAFASWHSGKPIGLGFDTIYEAQPSNAPSHAHTTGGDFVGVTPTFYLTPGKYYLYAMRSSAGGVGNTYAVRYISFNTYQ